MAAPSTWSPAGAATRHKPDDVNSVYPSLKLMRCGGATFGSASKSTAALPIDSSTEEGTGGAPGPNPTGGKPLLYQNRRTFPSEPRKPLTGNASARSICAMTALV